MNKYLPFGNSGLNRISTVNLLNASVIALSLIKDVERCVNRGIVPWTTNTTGKSLDNCLFVALQLYSPASLGLTFSIRKAPC